MAEETQKILPQPLWISMKEASRLCAYSQEYLSLLARRQKISSKKIGRNWYTTREGLDDYLARQSILISVPKNSLMKNPHRIGPVLSSSFSASEESKPQEGLHGPDKILDQGSQFTVLTESPAVGYPSPTPPVLPGTSGDQNTVLHKLDKLSDSLQSFTEALLTGNVSPATDKSRVDIKEKENENDSHLTTYRVDPSKGEIQLTGSSQLIQGRAHVYFDYSFSSVISETSPIRVIVTPTSTMADQLYVATKTQFGFLVKELHGADDGTFDWLVVACRRGYDTETVTTPPSPTLDRSSADILPPAGIPSLVSPPPGIPTLCDILMPGPPDPPTPSPIESTIPVPALNNDSQDP